MTITQAVELVIGAGGFGGLVKTITALTRLAVAVEDATKKIAQIIKDTQVITAQVQDHENRMRRAGH
jgi:hypothetical protein